MKVSVLPCVNCGSTELRRSHIHSSAEWLQAATGSYPFRCSRCHHRFAINVWLWSRRAFAKCPKCLGPTLTTWPAKNYRLPLWKNLLVTFGAHRYRCSACRYRFVSFRPIEPPSSGTPTPDVESRAALSESNV